MPHTLSIRTNPECLNFLKQVEYKKNVSARQKTFIDSVNDLHATVNQLKKQTVLQFDKKQEAEISRGAFYALTHSLEKKFAAQQPITLPDLQCVLNKEFRIKNEPTADFIIKSLLEPHSIPFALSILAYSVLTEGSFWSNGHTILDPEFKYTLKAKRDPSEAKSELSKENIIFEMKLDLRGPNFSPNSLQGCAQIQFSIDQQKKIKLLPLEMKFNFVDKKALKKFKNELCLDFRDWVFLHKKHWQTTDLWVIPVLLGCLLGLITMISLLALSLTPISPLLLLLPPLGFALGLVLATIMRTYVHISIKTEQEKFQRPIHLFRHQDGQATSFFDPPELLNPAITTETRFVL